MKFVLPLLAAISLFSAACRQEASSPETPAAADTVRVYFITPVDGDTVRSPVTIQMGVEGVRLAPAGTMEEGTGHLHILIDTDFIAPGQVIPNDSLHRHYGTGAAEATLELPAGPHTLRLQLADGAHIALEGDAYRDEIQIVVVE